MDRRRQLRRNVILMRMVRSLQYFMLMLPVIVVYYNANGMSMADVMLLQALFGVAMLVFEIPSGYFSDVLGRRTTLIIGAVCCTAGLVAYSFAHGFGGFLIGELILGVGAAFISGTDSAMLYDSLAELGVQERSMREEGLQLSFGNFSEAVSGILGGMLAMVYLELPIIVQAVVYSAMIPVTYMLVEPAEHRRAGRKAGIGEVLRIVARIGHHDTYAKWMLVTASFLGASTLTFVWLFQPYLLASKIPLWAFGMFWAGGQLVVGLCSMNAHRLHVLLGTTRIITLLVGIIVGSFVLLSIHSAWWLLPLCASFFITRGLSNPVFTTALNQRAGAHERSTVLSVRQLGMRLVFVVVAPCIGMVSDHYSLSAALLACAVIYGVGLAASLTMWRRVEEPADQRATVNAAEA